MPTLFLVPPPLAPNDDEVRRLKIENGALSVRQPLASTRFLASLPPLTELRLDFCALARVPEELSLLRSLRSLSLASNALSGTLSLSLPALEEFSLAGNALRRVRLAAPHLRALDLRANFLSRLTLAAPVLERLDLGAARHTLALSLGPLPALADVSLAGCYLGARLERVLETLVKAGAKIATLDVSGNLLSDDNLKRALALLQISVEVDASSWPRAC